MAGRRTRQEKMVAKLRRELAVREQTIKYTPNEVKQKNDDPRPIFYQPDLTLPVRLVWLDLTKTVAVTILALIVQLALFVWLTKGGWQWINHIFKF